MPPSENQQGLIDGHVAFVRDRLERGLQGTGRYAADVLELMAAAGPESWPKALRNLVKNSAGHLADAEALAAADRLRPQLAADEPLDQSATRAELADALRDTAALVDELLVRVESGVDRPAYTLSARQLVDLALKVIGGTAALDMGSSLRSSAADG